MSVFGYKAMNPDMTCRGFHYVVGKTYQIDGKPIICKRGFHFCENIYDVFYYYSEDFCIICEVEALGDVVKIRDKSCTNKIRIVRKLSPIELSRTKYGYGYGCGDGYYNVSGNGSGDISRCSLTNYNLGCGDHYKLYTGNGYGSGYCYGNDRGGGRGAGTFFQPMFLSKLLTWEE